MDFADGTDFVVDLFIGADGVHSRVRQFMFSGKPEFAQPSFSGEFGYRLSCSRTEIEESNPGHSAFRGLTMVSWISIPWETS